MGVTLGDPLFSDLNLTISKTDRIGLVAANGRGKSTLFACLAGMLEPTSGEVTRARGLRIGYVTQNVPEEALKLTLYGWVLTALPTDQAEYESWRVDVVLDGLKVPYDLQHKGLSELSGGWQRTAMLAAAWITEPDILLLDEPTNHLDLYRIGLLQDWLSALPREIPVVIISHDRAFLDATTNRTLFLRSEHSRVFQRPFTNARIALDEADAADERRFANDLNKAHQLRKQAAKLKNVGINSGSDLLLIKTKQLNERASKMEDAAKPAHQERSSGDIRLTNSGTHAKALITLDDIQVDTPHQEQLYKTGKKWISQGDRIVLLGANGTGKTLLIKMEVSFGAVQLAGYHILITLFSLIFMISVGFGISASVMISSDFRNPTAVLKAVVVNAALAGFPTPRADEGAVVFIQRQETESHAFHFHLLDLPVRKALLHKLVDGIHCMNPAW